MTACPSSSGAGVGKTMCMGGARVRITRADWMVTIPSDVGTEQEEKWLDVESNKVSQLRWVMKWSMRPYAWRGCVHLRAGRRPYEGASPAL